MPKSIRLTGIRIDCVTEAEVVARIISDLKQGRGGWVITPNVDHLRILHERPQLRAIVDQASLMLADGLPLVWASRLQAEPLPARVTGASLIESLTAAAAQAGASIFLLGGSAGSAEAAAEILRQTNPGLKIAGILSPPMGFDQDPGAMANMRETVVLTKPDILYSCFGFPKQEYVISELRESLPSTWFLGLGGSLSFISGEISRAPVWMQNVGLEWFWRLMKEPKRLFKRYIIHDLPFAILLFVSAIRNRRRSSAGSYRSDDRIGSVPDWAGVQKQDHPASSSKRNDEVIRRGRRHASD